MQWNLVLWGVFISIMSSGLITAQTITGRVYSNEQGTILPLPYANVFWKMEKTGTITDDNGIFNIKRPIKPDTLVVSFVGFKRVEMYIAPGVREIDSIILYPGNLLQEVEIREVIKGIEISHKHILLTQNIGKKELGKAACCNLSESFETNPLVESSFTDAISGMRQIELLGLSGKYSMLQIENVPFGRGLNQQMALSSIPGPWIESIQLTKGIGSVVNGYESMSGHINVELTKPESAPMLAINSYINNALRLEINALQSGLVNDFVSQHTLIHLNANPVAWDMNGDQFMDMPIGQQVNLQNKWKYSNGRNFEGQAGIRFVNDKRSGGTMDVPFDPSPIYQPGWEYRAINKRWELFTKNAFIFDTETPSSVGYIISFHNHESRGTFGRRALDAQQWSLHQNLIYSYGSDGSDLTFKSGITFQLDKINGYITDTTSIIKPDGRVEISTGPFAEVTWKPTEEVAIVGGLRLDHSNLFGFFATPRLHLKYSPAEKTTLRAQIGTGRRTPVITLESSQALMSNRAVYITDQLQQEIALNTGFSLQQDFTVNYMPFSILADYQHTYFYNQLIPDFDKHALEYHAYFTRGSSSNQLLIQADYLPIKRLETRLAYKRQWVYTQFADQRIETPFISPERWFFNAAYATRGNWHFDLTINRYASVRIPQTAEKGPQFQKNDRSPNFWLVHGQVKYTFTRGDIYLGVENLLNLRQKDPIISFGDPSNPAFDATLIWGPIFGRMVYLGLNMSLIQ